MSAGPASEWVPQFDQQGRKFFWNSTTNEVSWNPPGMPQAQTAPMAFGGDAAGAEGYGTETVPMAPTAASSMEMIKLDVIPDRRKTTSVEKAQMTDKERKFHKFADKRVPYLDVPLLEAVLFGLYLLLNLAWATIFAAPTWILADSWGYLAACNGLFVVIPAARNSVWSWVFGLPFDKTITIHRWLGRLTCAEATAHLVLYVLNGMPVSLFFSVAKYRNGVVSWLSLVVIFVTSLEYLRRKKYNVFYAAHFSFLLFYLFAALHTPKFHFYGIAAILIYGADKGQRFARGVLSTGPVANIQLLANSEILRVSIKKPWPLNQWWAAPQLGQYVFLNFPMISKWEWHPYTLASSPLEEHMEVNIKKLGDHTKQLVESCHNGDHPVVRVDGPYGKVIINPKRYRSLVMVSGGIGVTPMISMLRWYYLINTPAAVVAKQSVHLAEYIYFLWVVDKVSTYEVFKDALLQCVERSKQPGFPTLVPLIHVTREDTDPAKFGLDQSALFKGRPDMKYTLRTVKANGINRHAVYCCGPSQLVNGTWEAAGELSDDDIQFAFHHETFEF